MKLEGYHDLWVGKNLRLLIFTTWRWLIWRYYPKFWL